MDAEEIGRLIGELENRVERLRSLYEQYFMGIERIEPLIMRKDIDRRLWALRREQIRNTGLRFKLENTIQRYNTYQQYWQRIVREIEQGTYQRDFGRAAQRFGENVVTAFGRRRQRMFEKGVAKKAERDAQHGPDGSAPPAEAGEETPPSSNETEPDSAPSQERTGAGAAPHERLELEFDLGEHPVTPAVAPVAVAPPTAERRGPPPPPAAPPRVPALLSPRAPGAPTTSPANARPAVPAARPAPPAAPPTPVRPATRLATPTAAIETPSVFRPPVASRPDIRPPVVQGEGEDSGLSPIRLRQIYGAFVEAKRKANESTASVTYEKIVSNLERAAKELRAKHKARSVDFEVVMKNGKPVLKPVVKG